MVYDLSRIRKKSNNLRTKKGSNLKLRKKISLSCWKGRGEENKHREKLYLIPSS